MSIRTANEKVALLKIWRRSEAINIRIANMWNDLPSEIIEAPSLNCFKSLLDNYWV